MSEDNLNVKYIREKTGLVENDELIPIILEMIKDSYKAGLYQAEYDNTMDLMEENQKYKEVIDKASARLEYYLIGNLKYESSQVEFIKLLNILKEVQ